tara:strand:- start:12322 stop:13140 length:819 start_codon:yes stop_codon:yes gene_type:complete
MNFFLSIKIDELYYNKYEEVDLNFETYLLSDSHGDALGNLTEKINVYNFSAGGDSYIDMNRKLHFLIKNSKIQRVLVSVDDHTLSKYREVMNNVDRSSVFLDWKIGDSKEKLFKLIKNNYVKKYLTFFNIKGREVLKAYLNSKLRGKNNHYRKWNSLSLTEKIKLSNTRFNFQFNHEKSELLTSSLFEIINLSKENNIELIGVKFPLSNEYCNAIGDNSFEADHVFESKKINVIDNKKIFSENQDFFNDQDHLNKKGSIAFIEILSNIILIK